MRLLFLPNVPMGGMILLMVLTPIPERYGVSPGDREYMMTFFISGLMAIINEWLKGDCADDIGHIISVMQRCIPESRQ